MATKIATCLRWCTQLSTQSWLDGYENRPVEAVSALLCLGYPTNGWPRKLDRATALDRVRLGYPTDGWLRKQMSRDVNHASEFWLS
jgi:hypothetical protein